MEISLVRLTVRNPIHEMDTSPVKVKRLHRSPPYFIDRVLTCHLSPELHRETELVCDNRGEERDEVRGNTPEEDGPTWVDRDPMTLDYRYRS